MSQKLTFARASESDFSDAMEIIASRVKWLGDSGSRQWNSRDFSDDTHESIAAGATWILRDEMTSLGVINMTTIADPDFWTDQEQRQPALYFGRMATHIEARGKGLGALLLQLARAYASQNQLPRVRWDVWRGNRGLYDFYETQGGKHLRTVEASHRGSGALFEIAFRLAPSLPSGVDIVDPRERVEVPSIKRTPLLPDDGTGIGFGAGVSHYHQVEGVRLSSDGDILPMTVPNIDAVTKRVYFSGSDWHVQDFYEHSVTEWSGLPELDEGIPYILKHFTDNARSCGVHLVGANLR